MNISRTSLARTAARFIMRPYVMLQTVASPSSSVPGGLPSSYLVDISSKIDLNKNILYRDELIRRIIYILGKNEENCPVLVGDPGVGKTAIVEELARRIKSGNLGVKESLGRVTFDKSTRVIGLDLGGLQALRNTPQQLDEEVKGIIAFIEAEEKEGRKIILLIDEIHRMPGDFSKLDQALKEPTGKGTLQIIGATTELEYRRTFENDPALQRRFPAVFVPGMTKEQSVRLLESIYSYWEKIHGVTLQSRKMVKDVVDLAYRYMSNRVLPGSAISLLDCALSTVAKRQELLLNHLVGKKKILQSLIETWLTRGPLAELEGEINKLVSEIIVLNDALCEEVAVPNKIVTKEDILRSASEECRRDLNGMRDAMSRESLIKLGPHLKSKIIGQDEAVDRIVRLIQRAKVGVREANKPVCAVMMLGPTGVGKTEIARQLTLQLVGDLKLMIRFDMAEFKERHAVSRLLGSPPGYVNSNDGGELINAVRRNPEGVILLDEIEKAHPDIFEVLFGILEDATASSRMGTRADFSGTKILMTSNLTRDELELLPHIKPFLNRLDAVVTCNELSETDMRRIVPLRLAELRGRLAANGNRFEWTEGAVLKLAELGYSPEFGARPLKRVIGNIVEDQVTDLLLAIDREKLEANQAPLFTLDISGEELKVSHRIIELPIPARPVLNEHAKILFERLEAMRGESRDGLVSLDELDELLGIDALPHHFSVDTAGGDKFTLSHMNPQALPMELPAISSGMDDYLSRFGIKKSGISACRELLRLLVMKAAAANLDSYLKREFGKTFYQMSSDPRIETIVREAQGKFLRVAFGQENDEGLVVFVSNESRMAAKEKVAMRTLLENPPATEEAALEFYQLKLREGIELDLDLLMLVPELYKHGFRLFFERVEGETGYILKIPAPRVRLNGNSMAVFDNNYEKGTGLKEMQEFLGGVVPPFARNPERREYLFDWFRSMVQRAKEINAYSHYPNLGSGDAPIVWDQSRHLGVRVDWVIDNGYLTLKVESAAKLPEHLKYFEDIPASFDAICALCEQDEKVCLTDLFILHALRENRFKVAVEFSGSSVVFSVGGRIARKQGNPETLRALLSSVRIDLIGDDLIAACEALCLTEGGEGFKALVIREILRNLQRDIDYYGPQARENLLKALLEIDCPDAIVEEVTTFLKGLNGNKNRELADEVIGKIEENLIWEVKKCVKSQI